MASTVYETDNCRAAGHFFFTIVAIRVVRAHKSKILSSREAEGELLLEKLDRSVPVRFPNP